MKQFNLTAPYKPTGDQPKAIKELVEGIRKGKKFQTLLGVTGSGKTFTLANVIEQVGKPTLVISHNKTLAAQLYGEFKTFFPENAVEYFISYYDYYQPEAYIPERDLYIGKDASINDLIEELRLRATTALLSRNDCIIVASVSAIYGLGSPEDHKAMLVLFEKGETIDREELINKLVNIQYTRNDIDFARGTFRVFGDIVEIHLAYEKKGIRIKQWGDEIEKIEIFDPVSLKLFEEVKKIAIYPAKHFITPYPRLIEAIKSIEKELEERLSQLRKEGKELEAHRLETRTRYDIEMLGELGYCPGVENYSRHLSGRKPGERPSCLLDFFPRDFLTIIDESHVTIPQIRGMYNGDRSRKETLVKYGFRLPSALDNRPLRFDEFEKEVNYVICSSATPAEYEIKKSGGVVVEQIIRPTGLVDPEIEIRPVKGQIDNLIEEIRERTKRNERVLVTTLTKRMAEDLAEYLADMDIKVKYMHSEIDAIQRVEILRGLRLKEFDVLVGINLLREGLDLPEVSLVAILDADKEGFLRSETSLIQVSGRAARNVRGKVIMYASNITRGMKNAIKEMNRRREIQIQYNKKHNITPRSIVKSVDEVLKATAVADTKGKKPEDETEKEFTSKIDIMERITQLEYKMKRAAENLEFEDAAFYRDKIKLLEKKLRKKSG
ncbi:MAG: excinuclease ABC subunit B [Candidatus Cloacimonas sp. 4484_209]|nr:MAG: excinuclease ABC subunit B [Candidatus Cloacimonas sp. 4484_209]